MSIGLLFWILMILWVVFGFVPLSNPQHRTWGGNLLLAILFALLGYAVFGAAIHR